VCRRLSEGQRLWQVGGRFCPSMTCAL
jgi:hypothetical protein